MRQPLFFSLGLAISATLGGAAIMATPAPVDNTLAAAIAAPHRSEANRARDQYRHPSETLAFFGLKPAQNVVELWPGAGWYTEILAPYLAANGTLTAASPVGRQSARIA
jgi:predicted methyltransferase